MDVRNAVFPSDRPREAHVGDRIVFSTADRKGIWIKLCLGDNGYRRSRALWDGECSQSNALGVSNATWSDGAERTK